MINETILAIIIAFAISAILCPIVIPFLHRLKFGQQVREEGPESHLKKQGTPTMGGLIILTSIIITSLFYVKDYPKIIPILFMTVGFGIVGFLDDYIKIVMKRSEGLKPLQKIIGQFIITGVFAYYLLNSKAVGTSMLIPFTGGFDKGLYLNLYRPRDILRAVSVLCCAGNRQRCELHRRSRWTLHQRDDPGGHLLNRGGPGGESGDQPDHRRGRRQSPGLPAV